MVVIALALAACGGSTASPNPGVSVTPSIGSLPSPSVAPALVDPTLLAVLPEEVGGVPIVETPEAERANVTDPAIARAVARLATGYAVSSSGSDWAVVSVAALRPGVWSEAFFRDWRDTYDTGVCAQAGGIGGRAAVTIAGRDVEITSCGGLHTYHVHLPGRDVLLSVTSVGDARFGEQMVAGLRP